MECKFWVGQKVVPFRPRGYENHPRAGKYPLDPSSVYTISEISLGRFDGEIIPCIRVSEAPLVLYVAFSFRPATDISIFHEIVAKAKKEGKVTV